MMQDQPVVRAKIFLLLLVTGSLSVFCLARWQVPSSTGYLRAAVLAGVLGVGGTTFLIWRKSQYWFLGYLLIPGWVYSAVGLDFYPLRSTAFIPQLFLFAQWLVVEILTFAGIAVCIVIGLRLQKKASINRKRRA